MSRRTYDPPYNLWSGNRSDSLNKWKVNYLGTIPTVADLPEEGTFKGDTYNIAAFENQPHLCRRKNDCHFYKETSETESWSWRRGKERIWKSWHSVSESQAAR